MIKHLPEAISDALLMYLPINLLYLYYAGGWQEPNTVVLLIELVVLFLIPIFGLLKLILYLYRKVGVYEELTNKEVVVTIP